MSTEVKGYILLGGIALAIFLFPVVHSDKHALLDVADFQKKMKDVDADLAGLKDSLKEERAGRTQVESALVIAKSELAAIKLVAALNQGFQRDEYRSMFQAEPPEADLVKVNAAMVAQKFEPFVRTMEEQTRVDLGFDPEKFAAMIEPTTGRLRDDKVYADMLSKWRRPK